MSLGNPAFSADLAPSGLAITNNGMIYFDTADINGTGTPLFHKLNTATQSITDLGELQAGGIIDKFDRVLLSPDGTKIYSGGFGQVNNGFWVDTSNDQIHILGSNYLPGGFSDVAISADGSTVDVGGQLTDSSLDP